MAALAFVLMGWPPPFILWIWLAVIPVGALFPFKALAADRDGIALGYGRENGTIDWDTVTRVVVEGRAGAVTVGVRARPESTVSARPNLLDRLPVALRPGRARGDRPFAVTAEVTVAGRSAAEVAERIRGVTSVPVSVAGETDEDASYRVRAPRRSVLPMAIFALVWIGGLGSAVVITTLHDHPGAAIPFILVGVGVLLALADVLTPRWVLAATGNGLYLDGEFLAWDEIDAIGLGIGQNGTELLVRLTPGTRVALIAPEVRRTLPRVDPARLAAVLPPDLKTDAITPA